VTQDFQAAQINALVQNLALLLKSRNQTMATAESCTGGLIAAALTAISGSSQWFERGWVTYSNASKIQELAVPDSVLGTFGAVSEPVAAAMAEGARKFAKTNVALSVTGIAGPDGGSVDKPVGTVCFGWSTPSQTHTEICHYTGSREAIRRAAVLHGIAGLIHCLRLTDNQ
jgi:nicotinamide-nucleotide amidase